MKTTRQLKATANNPTQIDVAKSISSTITKAPATKLAVRRRETAGNRLNNSTVKDLHPVSSLKARVLPIKLPIKESGNTRIVNNAPISVTEHRQKLQSSAKTNMQLFPVDEVTRKGLEKDGYIPFLELNVSERKKMSSVFKHLKRKWGRSPVAMEELVLFPYNVQSENLASCNRWTADTLASTADVYVAVGRPSEFRLRYGWFSNLEPINSHLPPTFSPSTSCLKRESIRKGSNLSGKSADGEIRPFKMFAENLKSTSCSDIQYPVGSALVPLDRAYEPQVGLTTEVELTLSSFWASNVSTSVGTLFREASLHAAATSGAPKESSKCPPTSFHCDSFDAAILAIKNGCPQGIQTPVHGVQSSFFEADQACDEFSFHRLSRSDLKYSSTSKIIPPGSFDQNIAAFTFKVPKEAIAQLEDIQNHASQEPKADSLLQIRGIASNDKGSLHLINMNWNDSLGTLDLCLASSQDYISFSSLLASSRDSSRKMS